MKLISIIGVLLFALPANAQVILLDKVWGFNIPGTKDIAGIPFPENGVGRTFDFQTKERTYNIEQIRLRLASKPPTEQAGPGLALPHPPDSHMLSSIPTLMRSKKYPFRRNFPADSEYTLFFFSHPMSYYCRLRHVERDGSKIIVQYQFEPHYRPEATLHFALIPLGKLEAGKYEVEFEQLPMEQEYRDQGFEPVNPDDVVCRSFIFEVGVVEPIRVQEN
jgi:hypothetical protein